MFRSAISYCLFLVVLCACHTAAAQKPLLRHYTQKEGLPSNVVYNIFEDRRGFLWFFTDQGISQFDGHHFQNFSINEGLPDNEVFHMAEDNEGRLWVVCLNKQACYIKDGRICNAGNDPLCRKVDSMHVRYLAQFKDSSGRYYLLGENTCELKNDNIVRAFPGLEQHALSGTCYAFNDGYHYLTCNDGVYIQGPDGTSKYLSPGFKSCLRSMPLRDNLVIMTSDTCYHYRMRGGGLMLLKKQAFKHFGYSIQANADSGFYLCMTSDGIFNYDVSTMQFFRNETFPGSKPFNRILLDREGNTWLSTLDDGIYKRSKMQAVIYQGAEGIDNDKVLSLSRQADGSATVNYSDGSYSHISSPGMQSYVFPASGNLNRIIFSQQTAPGTYLVGTDRGLFQLKPNLSQRFQLSPFPQKAICRAGPHFFTATYSGVIQYEAASNQTRMFWEGHRSTAIAARDSALFWIGTLEGLYECREAVIKKLEYDRTLSNSRITSLEYNPLGFLCVGTHKAGFFLWDGSGFTNINTSNGLSSNNCKRVISDSKGNVWVNTDRGLDRIRLLEGKPAEIYHYSAADGVPDYVRDISVNDSVLYLATSEGIVSIPSVGRPSLMRSPPVYILSVRLHDTLIMYPDSRLSLPYSHANLEIRFTGISLSAGDDMRYRYVLEGNAVDTVYTSGGYVSLGALKPGSYTFKIWAASGGAENWSSQPASLSFRVRAPFWLELWFIALCTFGIALLVSLIYRQKVKSVRHTEARKAEQLRRTAELEMQALRAQINPHFIFNALNSIQHFYAQNNEREANRYLSLFSQLIRKTLHSSRSQWLLLSEELSIVNAYIELEKMRFEDSFTYSISVEPALEADRLKVPAMLLQPFIENAIIHGLRPLTDRAGQLLIKLTLSNEDLICQIRDNGVGVNNSPQKEAGHKSAGLEICMQRIATINLIYNLNISMQIEDKSKTSEPGTCVTLLLPIIKS
jgi:ligand-binding sensor domain-containing protein/two-component sensor histidine kinase